MTDTTCSEMRDLMAGYIDGELPVARRSEVEAHLRACPACRAECDALSAIARRIRIAGPSAMPAGLARRVTAAIDAEDGLSPRRGRAPSWRRYGALAASHLVVAALSAGTLFAVMSRAGDHDRALREVVTAHTRAALTNQIVQVASSDTHTVKPWLAARLPYSPDVRDYKASGFPLIGGRIEFLLDEPVAVLVYARREHTITVLTVPADRAAKLSAAAGEWRGYHVVGWRDAGFAYVAATDLNRTELSAFVAIATRVSAE